MREDFREASIANLSHTQNANRSLLEKALKMRCEGYLAEAKTALLTKTIFEVNRGKQEEHNINLKLREERETIAQQKAELEEVNRLLEESNADLEAYAYTVSHDLKNPVSAILGLCELLEAECSNANDMAKHYLSLINSSIRGISEQIDGLLLLSESSGGKMNFEKVNLSDLAQNVVNELKVVNPERQISVTIEPGMTCSGDKHLLKSLLQNLLSNAWKYTRGINDAQLRFSRHAVKSGKAIYAIEDNGVGFDISTADRLFQPFQRLHDKEQFEGSGIGLATVKRIILRHHGEVWADSEINKGTTIYFSLPNSRSHQHVANKTETSKESEGVFL